MWETWNDLLSFGDGNTAGNLETKPKAAHGCWDTALRFFFPVLQITSPDHLEVNHDGKKRLKFTKPPATHIVKGQVKF